MKNKKSILIVEDDEDLVDALELKFEKIGFQVWVATNGAAGLRAARSVKPSVILLDIMLPKIGGLEVLEKIKSDSITKKIPVVLLTNLSEGETISKGLSLGAESYIIKSSRQLKSIVDTVKRAISGA